MCGLPALATRLARLVGRKLVSRALLMGGLPALAARLSRLVGGKLMGRTLLMGDLAAFTCYFALTVRIHRSEAAAGRALIALTVRCHGLTPSLTRCVLQPAPRRPRVVFEPGGPSHEVG